MYVCIYTLYTYIIYIHYIYIKYIIYIYIYYILYIIIYIQVFKSEFFFWITPALSFICRFEEFFECDSPQQFKNLENSLIPFRSCK